MYNKFIILLYVILLFPLVSLVAQKQDPKKDAIEPSKVSIKPEKKEVLPGEVIEIMLTGFVDDGAILDKNSYILVEAKKGQILGGDNPVSPKASPKARLFIIGRGITVKYMAPTGSSAKQDTIIVRRSQKLPSKGYEDNVEGTVWKLAKLGETQLTVIHHNIAKLRYTHYYHNTQGEAPFTREIMVEVSLHFEALGGAGISIPYTIKSAAVMSFSGTAKGKDTDYTLVSAKPVGYKSTLTVYVDQLSGQITAVVFPRLSAMLSWEGQEGYVPPKTICLEPVTKWDSEKAEKNLETEANKLEAEMESGQGNIWKNMNRIVKIQKALAGVLVHPDYQVKNRWERNWVSGEAKFKDSGDGWVLRKSFTWDLKREK